MIAWLRKYTWYLLLAIYLLSTILLIQAMLRTKKSVPVSMDLRVSELTFELLSSQGHAFLADANFSRLEIENSTYIKILGDCLTLLDLDSSGVCKSLTGEELEIIQERKKLELVVEDVFWEKLQINYPASMSIRSANRIHLDVYSGIAPSSLVFDEELFFRLQKGKLPAFPDQRAPLKAKIEAFEGEILFEGGNNVSMGITWQAEPYIESQLEIRNLQFLRDLHNEAGDQLSSIFSGTIEVEGLDEKISLEQEKLFLRLSEDQNAQLISMKLGTDTIRLKLTGIFDQVSLQEGKINRELLPSWAEWTWKNYQIQIILYAFFMLLLTVFVIIKRTKYKQRKVIFVALANKYQSNREFLPALMKERKLIEDSLLKLDKQVELLVVPDASIDDIFNKFKDPRYKDRICVFHFAGHGGGSILEFESVDGKGETAHMKHLIDFLKDQTKLKLVFLNACETLGQIQYLQAAGIPNAILTDQKIGDDTAATFAQNFYENLANEFSFKAAYTAAGQEVLTYSDQHLYRDIFDIEPEYSDTLPWIGYFGEEEGLV